jgi:protoporphyrinogen oxidase
MRIGIIGGGLMGVALAYFLSESGLDVTLLEQGNHLGGLNDEIHFGEMRVPRYQNPILSGDLALLDLCARMGLQDEIVFQKAASGFVHEHKLYSMANLLDFLSFPVLNIRDRMRLGTLILRTQGKPDWASLDAVSAGEWLLQNCGPEAFDRLWRPLLEAKFDGVYDRVAASYIWAWLNRMSSIRRMPSLEGKIGYLRHGHYSLVMALAKAFVERGGHVQYDTRVQEIELGDGRVQRIRATGNALEFDLTIAAIATPALLPLLPGISAEYRASLAATKYLGLVCPVMVLDRPLSEFWTLNLTDPTIPFATVVEMPHPSYQGYTVVHLPRFTAPDNDWLGVSDEVIREAWVSHLKMIFPQFDERSISHFAVSRSRYVEPVYSVGMLANRPAVMTPYAGLALVNSSQVYPELPTSNATVAHAQRVAQQIIQGQFQAIG